MTAIEQGRDDLGRWLAEQPRNFFEADSLLRILVEQAVGHRIDSLFVTSPRSAEKFLVAAARPR